ncbi:hypothetical protein VC81_05295 [Levilactobacillus spicheri]|uniref:Uncharacterized protein n=1 Tax=Levilactobacillus spicheri TaxID=216463 RepID=A0A0F3RT07_9LACO|nr:hypothetical protein VC81_05295 [Levilactobacillus spicheri]
MTHNGNLGPTPWVLFLWVQVAGRCTPASKLAEVGTILKLRQKRGSPELGLGVIRQGTPNNTNFTTASKSPLFR